MSAAKHTPLQLVPERVPMDRFENAIREVGVAAACEWFGHDADSEFTKSTIAILAERAAIAKAEVQS
jgi:hypothetical protein